MAPSWRALLVTTVLCVFATHGKGLELVQVDFYGEALCPYCAEFTRTTIDDLFKKGFGGVMNFTYVPWGNARYVDGQIQCQHGIKECELNKFLSCAIHSYPEQQRWFPFLRCVEEVQFNEGEDKDASSTAKECAKQADLDLDKLTACYTSDLGEQLQKAAAAITEQLVPPHRYVPWVVVNGIPLFDNFDLLEKFVCVAAENKPSSCLDPEPDSGEQLRQVTWATGGAAEIGAINRKRLGRLLAVYT